MYMYYIRGVLDVRPTIPLVWPYLNLRACCVSECEKFIKVSRAKLYKILSARLGRLSDPNCSWLPATTRGLSGSANYFPQTFCSCLRLIAAAIAVITSS